MLEGAWQSPLAAPDRRSLMGISSFLEHGDLLRSLFFYFDCSSLRRSLSLKVQLQPNLSLLSRTLYYPQLSRRKPFSPMSLRSTPITVYANSFEKSEISTQVYYQIHGKCLIAFLGSQLSHLFNSWFVDSPVLFFQEYMYPFFFVIEFRPKVEDVHRRRRLIHHLQNVVAPDVFDRRIVYDGDSIAYSPGRLPLTCRGWQRKCILINSSHSHSLA